MQPQQPGINPLPPQQPMQPQPQLQPQQPVMPQMPVQPVMQQPAMQQPVMQQPAPQQPNVIQPNVPGQPVGMPMQPQMPMQPMGAGMSMGSLGGKKSMKKVLIPVILVIVSVGVFFGLSLLRNQTPSYKAPVETTFNGYKVSTYTNWEKEESSENGLKSVTYSDYVTDKKAKFVHAEHYIGVASNLVPKGALVAEFKQQIISEFTGESFFDGLKDEINSCKSISSKESKSVDALSVKNAFVVIDFNFACPEVDETPALKGIGRLVISNDGSLAVSVVGASQDVYTKNSKNLDKAAMSIVKE